MGRIRVLYDSDCGFCTRMAGLVRRLDRAGRLELVPLQRAGATIPDSPSEDKLLDRIHVRDADGQWSIGGAAWLRIADAVPALRPLGLVARLPFARPFVEPVYALVARHRHRINRFLGDNACANPAVRR